MDMKRQLDNFVKLKKEYENKVHMENSKIRMKNVSCGKIRTTMIGALAAMEKYFGNYWGQGKPINELGPEELKNYKLKEQMRKEIFDLGNKNIRSFEMELEQYQINWNKFNITFERND